MSDRRVWLITGASTGFGRTLAVELLEKGELVVATARQPESLADLISKYGDTLMTFRMDVTSPSQVRAAVAATVQRFGRIDVLVNNAGYGLIGAAEEPTDAEIRAVFETNVFGAFDVIRAVLPVMREQGSGHILNLSSQAGLLSFVGSGYYSSTKHALEGLSEALAMEVEPFGIKVTLIEPGPFRTDFAGRSLQYSTPMPEYSDTVGKRRDAMRAFDGTQSGDPVKAAHAMMRVVESPNPPLRLLLGKSAWDLVHGKLDRVKTEFEAWKDVTLGADYDSA